MILVARPLPRLPRRRLLVGASIASLTIGLAAPAQAQTVSAMLGAQASRPRPATAQQAATPQRSPTMQGALTRQQTTQARIAQIRAYATQIRGAVDRGAPANGLDPNGLDPTDAIRQAIAATRAGDTDRANALLISAGAATDATGLNTWEGAALPSQTVGADGKVTVTIDQSQERALLSWNRFDIGTGTTLTFNQKQNGTAQAGWVAVNRVTNATDPSLILGNLKADGTVVVLNRAGIIFGKNSQVNTHSLLASTLELGGQTAGSGSDIHAATIKDRNSAFFDAGLFPSVSVNQPFQAKTLVSAPTDTGAQPATGKVIVDRGAQLTTGSSGFLILAAPKIESSGILRAVDGQVSLQAGNVIGFTDSSGSASSIDPYARGYILFSPFTDTDAEETILVDGLIESRRGYLSLGTGAAGTVTLNGLLSATTSVSRNGKISLGGGKVTVAGDADPTRAAGIELIADDNGETVPQGSPTAPATFKTSQLAIGAIVGVLGNAESPYPITGLATTFTMGENALVYAPGGNVSVVGGGVSNGATGASAAAVSLAWGATVDVGGYKDVALDAARNSIAITPVKRNELRDTPNYREVALDGTFSLNGATLYVDPRISGVRDDGVAWVGSPLIEAGSIAGQIGVTAKELLTKAGSVTLTAAYDPAQAATSPVYPASATIAIAKGATIDYSGGWVSYAAGTVRTSRLLTDDGRIVDIARANPNDTYVAVVDGLSAVQPRFGVQRTYLNAAGQGLRYDAAYDEGRDAGRLRLEGGQIALDGTVFGNAFAGARQIATGLRPSLTSPIAGDLRRLQRSTYELPSGGGLAISTTNMLVYHGERGAATPPPGTLLLSDTMLSGAELSALQLTGYTGVVFAGEATPTLPSADVVNVTGASHLTLAPGGALSVESVAGIRFDGTVTAASGTITARTTALKGKGDLPIDLGQVRGARLFLSDPGPLSPFDVTVTGTLSTAGLWVNDYTEAGAPRGGAFRDGGSISLTAAPNLFAAVGSSLETATRAIDLSGSVRVSGTLDASAGGYVTTTGGLVLDGKGGNVTLSAATRYASTELTNSGALGQFGDPPFSNFPIDGTSQSVDFTPVPENQQASIAEILPQLVPSPRATVDIGNATILGFGFAGGGTFSLVAPDISFGSDTRPGATHVGLDVFQKTGFGTLSLSSYRSRIVDDVFTNTRASASAFLETSRFVVNRGETLDLTQWLLPSLPNTDQSRALRSLGSGSRLVGQSFLAPTKMADAWDQKAAHLVLGGLTELDVLAGGTITGAAQASLTVSKLYNAGTIALHGGILSQRNDYVDALVVGGLGVRDVSLGGKGLADAFGGDTDAQGRFDEAALNAAGITDPSAPGRVITNRELVTKDGADRLIYFLGMADAEQGIVLAPGSVTDLSGTALINPRAGITPDGRALHSGRVLDGGTISLASGTLVSRITTPRVETVAAPNMATLVRDDRASVDISGASAWLDQLTGLGTYTPYFEWSAAGGISALGGGTLGTTAIKARGGAAQAEGGSLEWLRPTVGTSLDGAADYLSATMIAQSGFDSLIARNTLNLDGTFSLSLRKALMLLSQDPTVSATVFGRDAQLAVTATKGTRASIAAPYIRFASRVGTPGTLSGGPASTDAQVAFVAGGQGIDVVGGLGFAGTIASAALVSAGDLRLTGVMDGDNSQRRYNGNLVSFGDLLIDARRTYATTGTGNLQALLEGQSESVAQAFAIAAFGDHSVVFGNHYLDANAAAPLSAGTHLRVLASRIEQNGYLAAPLGSLELGSTTDQTVAFVGTALATQSLRFGTGSVTTVSGAGLSIPYGTTTDLIEYYYPTLSTPITRLPAAQLSLSAVSIVEDAGARVDGRGGGDVFAYEFQSGVGGSRDVLDRINRDAFSSNGYDLASGTGYQYADKRQVFALVPVSAANRIAPYDPLFSADYGSAGPVDLYGARAGLTVTLDGAPGVAQGEYLLVPAKYAMAIPGALRLVENGADAAPPPGQSATLLDGSIVVGGTYGFAGTGIAESTRRGFTVQNRDTFLKFSTLKTTSGSDYLRGQSVKNGTPLPRLPLDAARVVLSPLTELRIAGAFDTRAAAGGQGGQFDLLGQNLIVAVDASEQTSGAITVAASSLANLDATSLLIGGRRSEAADGTTAIQTSATSILVQQGVTLDTPELLLAVGGVGSTLTVGDGVTLKAAGSLGTQPATDYSSATAGALLRLASSGERLVTRTGTGNATLSIGAATLSGGALALDTSGTFAVADAATIAAQRVAISGTGIRFDSSADALGQSGVIGAGLEAKLAHVEQLTVRSPNAIRFSAGTHHFGGLVLDTATIAALPGTGDAVTIDASGDVRLGNSAASGDGCSVAGFCGTAASLTLNAATLRFGANAVRAAGFSDTVTLAATNGIYVEGKGSFATGGAALSLNAPFLADRALVADPRQQKVRPEYSFLTNGAFTLAAPNAAAITPSGDGAPGASISIGSKDAPVVSATITGSLIRATAGLIDIQSSGDIRLAGATLSTPGYERVFGDKVDAVTVAAGAGTIQLLTQRGDLAADAASTLITDTGVGSAGALNLFASNGAIQLAAALNPGVTGSRLGGFALDTGRSSFDLSSFVRRYGRVFGGDVAVRSGAGDLSLGADQTLKAKSVQLTADGGRIAIAGTIDTAGVDVTGMTADAARDAAVNGGDIALWGRAGVTLAATAKLDTHTSGYADMDSRVASAGDVTIGIADAAAAIDIAQGAVIDVGARRTEAALAAGETGGRLVPQAITDQDSGSITTVYRYAAPDAGGSVSLRAPVLGAAEDQVAVSARGTIRGATSVELEAFKRYDLDALLATGLYSGITREANGTLALSFAASSAAGGKFNPFTENFTLADGSSSVVRFIQNLSVHTQDGSSLAGIRVRPGIELAGTGGIKTTTQWNLAAASFSKQQLQDATAAGALKPLPELSVGGQTRYQVVTGQEGTLLDRFATFLYRTGGTARGEAPIITFRAGGDLTINRSISDGFFTFRDQSDPAFTNYQLGGGDRVYSPAIQFTCGFNSGNCGSIVSYSDGIAHNPGASGTLTIGLGSQAVQGTQTNGNRYVNAPLAIAGNGAAAGGEGQDSLGFAELFPLLDGSVAMHSSDVRLVAGADSTLSANPLHVDRARTSDMIVAGEYGYRLTATGTVRYNGPLQFQYVSGQPFSFDIGSTLDLTTLIGQLNTLKDDAYTQLNWGTSSGLGADARAAAQRFFAGKGYSFVGAANAPTGIIAPLNQIVAFFQTFESTYQAGLASNRAGYAANMNPPILRYGSSTQQTTTAPNVAYVRSFVRSGDGAITVAAARDVDLRGAADLNNRAAVTYRTAAGVAAAGPTGGSDFSAAALYTAGVRVANADVQARIVGGGLATIRLDSPYLVPKALDPAFIPSPKALSNARPVLAWQGGDISLSAGRDVLGARDLWSETSLDTGSTYAGAASGVSTGAGDAIGMLSQRWRTGDVGIDTEIGIAPRYFASGVGALAGGDVSIEAGRDAKELTVALTNSVTTAPVGAGAAMLAFGTGDLTMRVGRDLLAGRIDVASGAGTVSVGRDIAALGTEAQIGGGTVARYTRVRIADAAVDMSARGSVTLASISALGVSSGLGLQSPASIGFFSPFAKIGVAANERLTLAERTIAANGADYGVTGDVTQPIQVLPPSVSLTSLAGQVVLPPLTQSLLFPSAFGQLRLFSDGDLNTVSLTMSDVDPGLIGGAFSAAYSFALPVVGFNPSDALLRTQHARQITHLGDPDPVRIYTNGSIDNMALFLPKQARVTAGGDIVDLFFSGQNVSASDVTRIRAGGDIRGSMGSFGFLPYVRSNDFLLGGPGTFIVEAGGDIGPFATSADIRSQFDGRTYSLGGGIRTIGNDYNPWLPAQGADLQVRFGMAKGADYDALRESYLNPANFAKLDGDLFVQTTDTFGNKHPDRSKPIYAPLLAAWLRDTDPAAFAAIFAGQSFASDAALADAAYSRAGALYDAFAKIDPLRQQGFLIDTLYFNEIAEVGNPQGPSFQQYIRGYRAIQTLFPAGLGYTDNLAAYTTDPATISSDHPLGEPVRAIVNGQPQTAVRVRTGNADLRLATWQTARGGDITLLAPGGDVLAGSVVRTSEQAKRRATAFSVFPSSLGGGVVNRQYASGSGFDSVPLGYEGVLTLRGGQIRAFTDGDFILNQSRVFTQSGGNITMWSSNGDLNAGQGPKSASAVPSVTVRFDTLGLAEVNTAGSVSGAGIGTFKRVPTDPPADVILIAPVGTVDAGDAGVRASGNVVVAAARVANADNFKAAGDITGVPQAGITTVNVTPNASNEVQAQIRGATRAAQASADRRIVVTIDVLGPVRDGRCDDRASDDPDCAPTQP